jgi:hypothetical protein
MEWGDVDRPVATYGELRGLVNHWHLAHQALTMRSDGRITASGLPNCQRFEFKLGINRQTDFRPSSAHL